MIDFVYSCRVGSIFIVGTAGLRTFGRERPTEKGDFILRVAVYILAILKMVGAMAKACALILMD